MVANLNPPGERGTAPPAPTPLDDPATPAVRSRRDALGVGPVASEIAHALGTPLATLTTSIDLIAGGQMSADETAQISRVMRNGLAKLESLLARCRELRPVTALELTRTDLAALVRARLDTAAPELAAKSVALTTALPGAPVWMLADRAQLSEALEALLANAEEAMPEGGALTLSLTPASASGTSSAADAPARWALALEDTGAGIASTSVRNVFRLFFTTRSDHAGVGLSLVQQVVGAHGGEVEVRSLQGRGTRVTLFLPALS